MLEAKFGDDPHGVINLYSFVLFINFVLPFSSLYDTVLPKKWLFLAIQSSEE